MKYRHILIIPLFIVLILSACGNTAQETKPIETEAVTENSQSQSTKAEAVYFYGDYVLEGNCSESFYYDRIIFFPNGKCYLHSVDTSRPDRDSGYQVYDYSFSSTSNKVGMGGTAGISGAATEIPSMSENMTLLKFENYVLKRVDE